MRHHTQRPRFSPTMRPASASTFVWCDTVGCDLPSGSSRSHEHTSPAVGDQAQERRRTGSAERGEHLGQVVGVGLVERRGQHRRAARLGHGDLRIVGDAWRPQTH